MSTNKPAEYVLHIKAMPTYDGDDAGIRRLRRLLKCLVRSFNLRCIRVVEAKSQVEVQE